MTSHTLCQAKSPASEEDISTPFAECKSATSGDYAGTADELAGFLSSGASFCLVTPAVSEAVRLASAGSMDSQVRVFRVLLACS